jgi:hypothetical protein
MDCDTFNARWLDAWTRRDVASLISFYDEEVIFRGPAVPGGIRGLDGLRAYLEDQFASGPQIYYEHEKAWPITGGYWARWHARKGKPFGPPKLRGVDFVVLKDEKIVLNEVYVHALSSTEA